MGITSCITKAKAHIKKQSNEALRNVGKDAADKVIADGNKAIAYIESQLGDTKALDGDNEAAANKLKSVIEDMLLEREAIEIQIEKAGGKAPVAPFKIEDLEESSKTKQNVSASALTRGPSVLMRRDDLVGAIMRVTGGDGISSKMAQDMTGDKAGSSLPKIRGLFTNNGWSDTGEIAMLLRDEEGYDVRDSDHLAELVREQAAGNPVYSMERMARESAENAEKQYKSEINRRAEELGLKKVGGKRTLQVVEAEIARIEREIAAREAAEERAAIQTSSIASDIYQEGSELSEADLMAWLGDYIEYTQEDIDEASARESEIESRIAEANALYYSESEAQGGRQAGIEAGGTQEGARGTVARGEVGKSLSKEDRSSVLKTLVDVYRKNNAPKEFKGLDSNGNERSGYAYSPEYFVRSDITGKMVRYFVTLPDGRIAHPTELFSDYTQSDIDAALQKQIAEEKSKEDGDRSRLQALKRRIGETLNVANRKYNAANPNRDDTVPAILTNGAVFIRTAPENVANDLRLLGSEWYEQKTENTGYELNGQTNAEAAEEYRRQQAESNQQDDEPTPSVKFDQGDLLNTQGALIINNRDTESTSATTKQVKDENGNTATEVTLPSGNVVQIQKLNATESMGLAGWHGPDGYLADTKDDAVKALVEKDAKATPAVNAEAELNPLDYTPKQYHEAYMARIANEYGLSASEVKEDYDTVPARNQRNLEWINAVRAAARNGEELSRQTLDKLHELSDKAVAELMHDYPDAKLPSGYQVPDARKQEKQAADDKKADRAEIKNRSADAGEGNEQATETDSVVGQAEQVEPDQTVVEPISADDSVRSATQEKRIADFGEKIGGARKDKATPLGPRVKTEKPVDERPVWSRKFIAMEILDTPFVRKSEIGKWKIYEKSDKGRGAVKLAFSKIFDTEQEAMSALPHLVVAKKHRVYQFTTRQGNQEWGIFRNVTEKKRALVRGGFSSYETAMEYLAKNPEEIIEHKFGYPERPWLDRIERIGKNRLDGDVTTKMFQDTFGFRAGEFGNWNMGGDGQAALNHAYESLLDLADAIGVPPKAISLDGRLAIAFGARGTGGKGSAAAHYEPGAMVINLTKIKGAGSLAHEWWHAVDHYFAQNGGRKDSDSVVASGFSYNTESRPELVAAIKNVVDAMMYSESSQTTDADMIRRRAEKRIEEAKKSIDYYNGDLRGYLTDGTYNRGKKKATQEQLAQWDAMIERLKQGDMGQMVYIENQSKMRGALGFQAGEVIRDMNAIYKSVTGRSFLKQDPQSRGRQLVWQVESIKDNQGRMETKENETRTVKGRSSYFIEAKRIDNEHTSDYWSTPEEMGARAFESYIFDKLAEQEQRSDYLVHGVENRFYAAMDMYPYPEGAERKAINKAFDNLFSTVETKETDKGIAIYNSVDFKPLTEAEMLPTGQIVDTVNQLLEQFKTDIPVSIIDNQREVFPSNVADDGMVASGMVYKGRVFLIREGLDQNEAVIRTLFHELLHFGIRRFVPQAEYIEQMRVLHDSDPWIRRETRIWLDSDEGQAFYKATGKDANLAAARGVDEALAKLAEELNFERTQPGVTVRSKLASVVKNVMKWLMGLADKFKFGAVKEPLAAALEAEQTSRDYVESIFKKLREGAPPSVMTTEWMYSDPAFSRSLFAENNSKKSFIFSDEYKEKLSRFLNGSPIATLKTSEAPHQGYAKLREWAVGIFRDYGFKAINPEIGEVTMDERGVRDSMGHRMNPFKAVAFKVVPDVIENGKIVHKETIGTLDSYYISAPVSIDNTEDIVTVLVHQDPDTRRFYLHSVATKEYLLHHDQSGAPVKDRQSNPGGIRVGGIESILHDVLNFNAENLKRNVVKNAEVQSSKGAKQTNVTPNQVHSALVNTFGSKGISALQNAGILKIMRLEDAPDAIRKTAIAQNASALYTPDGVAYLFADRMTEEEAAGKLLHEVGEHYGLKRMLGKDGWERMKRRIATMAKVRGSVVSDIWNDVKKEYREFDGMSDEALANSDRFIQEIVAAVGEHGVGQKTSLWKEIVAKVKDWLESIGFLSDSVNERDVAQLVAGSLRKVMKEAQSGTASVGEVTMTAVISDNFRAIVDSLKSANLVTEDC